MTQTYIYKNEREEEKKKRKKHRQTNNNNNNREANELLYFGFMSLEGRKEREEEEDGM